MKILISNDDGIYAPGINALANALKTIAEVIVVAPDRDRSAASNSLTLRTPLRARSLESGFIAVEGTPTDCVHLAINGFLEDKPDIVVSGINDGANLGDDVLYSGTVAAALESRYLGSAAIAVSLVGSPAEHFATAAAVAKNLVLGLLQNPLPSQTLLNVNVPDVPINEIKGYEITRLGKRHPSEPILEDRDPRGKKIYWVGPPGLEQDAGPGTDFFAIKNCKVSVTPLQLDMTHYSAFDYISKWISNCDLTSSD